VEVQDFEFGLKKFNISNALPAAGEFELITLNYPLEFGAWDLVLIQDTEWIKFRRQSMPTLLHP